MKIRNGFVSNSSSSSFVVLGIKSDDDLENDEFDSIYVESDEDYYVTGMEISDDEYLEETETSLTELNEMAEKVAKALNVPVSEVKLFTGTRPS